MAKLAGKYGQIMVGAAPGVTNVLGCTAWTLDADADAVESTDYESDGHREFVAGNDGATGTYEANWETDLAPVEDPPDLVVGTEVVMNLYLSAALYITFSAIITKLTVSCPQPGIVTYSGGFTVDGEVDYSNAIV